MSVNISASSLKPRVCRPSTLSVEDHQRYFPYLVPERGWGYFTVSKQVNKSAHVETHCLRIPENGCCNIINEMQWYCQFCNKFPCQWRARMRHLKKCKLENHNLEINLNPYLFEETQDPDIEDLMKYFEAMDIEEIERLYNLNLTCS